MSAPLTPLPMPKSPHPAAAAAPLSAKMGIHRSSGLPKDRVQWTVRRWQVMDRAKGLCEHCGTAKGVHVRHLRFAAVVGHEHPSWLKLVCLACNRQLNDEFGRPRPPKRRKPAAQLAVHGQSPTVQQHRQRDAKAIADARLRRVCAHCGGTYPRAQHFAVCVRYELHRPQTNP